MMLVTLDFKDIQNLFRTGFVSVKLKLPAGKTTGMPGTATSCLSMWTGWPIVGSGRVSWAKDGWTDGKKTFLTQNLEKSLIFLHLKPKT